MRSHPPRRRSAALAQALQYSKLEPRQLLAGDVIISEFVASNTGSLEDVYGDSPDWIELHNRGDTAVDLAGYHLTDDPTDPIAWTFDSSSVIAPDEYKIVFASKRDEIDPAGFFHTNFSLGAGGEYIGLFDDSGALLSEYGIGGMEYPAQVTDISYGITEGTLVSRSTVIPYLAPEDASLESTWFLNSFDAEANGFNVGRAAIGYENNSGSATNYVNEILTEVPSGTTSVYLRNEFNLNDASAIDNLELNLKYDDGFGVWLNDTFLFSENANDGFAWNAEASAIHDDNLALQYQNYKLDGSSGAVGNFLSLLQDGQNTLAIHALNESPTSSDFLMSPQLVTSSIPGIVSYLQSPTPGQPNSVGAALGPTITDVTPSGTSISPGQSLVVTAHVVDFELPVEPGSVDLHYRVMFGSEVVVAMTDDGNGADVTAGDGIYSATINSSGVAAGQMVRWYVTAEDVVGTDSRAPLFFDALNSSEYYGTVVEDSAITTDLPVVQWFIEDANAANTDAGTRASISYDGNFYDNVRVDIHGQSTRGSEFLKKSYNFDSNAGEKFEVTGIGASTDFNLLTNYADQTKIRHPLSYEVLQESGVPALDGNAVMVYRNGSFYALYDVVEEGNEEYLERVGLDPNGALYKVNNQLNHAYSQVKKKTRNYENHDDLQELVDANSLSGTAARVWDFDNLDIADLVNFLAAEAITGNLDFGHKNMYWFRDTEGTGLWTALPWDQDLSFGHKWTANVSPPYFDNNLYVESSITPGLNQVYQRVYSEASLSEMYFRRLKTLSDQFYGVPGSDHTQSHFYQRIDQLEAQMANEIAADTTAWGIHPNFTASYPFTPAQALDQLRDVYISTRRTFFDNDSRVPDAQTGVPAILFDDTDFDSSPISGLQSEEYVRLNNPGSVSVDISGWKLSNGISHTFKPGTVIPAGGSLFVVADVVAFKGRSVGPAGGQRLFIQGNFDGNISNLGETIDLHSDNGTFVDSLATPGTGLTANQEFLRISEINYNPSDLVINGEFIEFLNTGASTLDLSGVSVTEGPSTPFVFADGTMLAPLERVLIVQDLAAFTAAYPSVDPAVILGDYSGKLSNAGEKVRLEEPGGELILEVTYNDTDPWYFSTDGEGQSLQLADEFNTSLLRTGKYYSWQPSVALNGTPGEAPLVSQSVVINEILAHTDLPYVDSIELFNPTGSPVLIGGMYLSDSDSDLLKYQIPSGIVLGSGEYIVFDENDFNPTPLNPGLKDFSLSAAKGDQVWLSSDLGTGLAIVDEVDFAATFNAESLGRIPNGTGRLLPNHSVSLGESNSPARVGPAVISEVNYHPEPPTASALAIFPTLTAQNLEFVEVSNPTLAAIDLTNWNLRGEVDFDFADGAMLPAGEALVVVTFDPELAANVDLVNAFRTHYGIDTSVKLVGATDVGNLDNSFGRVSLNQPDSPPLDDPLVKPRVLADEVVYDDLLPWPVAADGLGSTLNRVSLGLSGNEATNWNASGATPGQFAIAASVVTRSLFYNNSSFAGDLAMATDKTPLFNEVTATFENYSSYLHGINGLMVDVLGLQATPVIGDFQFKIGNTDDASGWGIAPAPTIAVRAGEGVGGSDRLQFVWNDGAVTNTWLQIEMTVAGLPKSDVFYFGNVIGETGNDLSSAAVNLADVALTRQNQTGFSTTDVLNSYDFNRDTRVNLVDVAIARQNQSGFSPVRLITPGASGSLRNAIDGPVDNGSKDSNPGFQMKRLVLDLNSKVGFQNRFAAGVLSDAERQLGVEEGRTTFQNGSGLRGFSFEASLVDQQPDRGFDDLEEFPRTVFEQDSLGIGYLSKDSFFASLPKTLVDSTRLDWQA